MTDEEVALLVKNEFAIKSLGVTEQYLEIHEPLYVDGELKIERIDRETRPNLIIAYLPVKDEYFHFAVYIDTEKREVFNVGTESRNMVYLRATSDTMDLAQLCKLCNLTPTKAWNKGDLKPNKKLAYKFSCVEFEPNPEPDEVEDKLKKLLLYLQNDKPGVHELVTKANAYVQVIMDFHAGNQILGSAGINLECIKLLADLNLEISFDITAWGEPFK